jgi:hypothetical protein
MNRPFIQIRFNQMVTTAFRMSCLFRSIAGCANPKEKRLAKALIGGAREIRH